MQRDAAVEGGLPAEGEQDAVRPFLFDHALHEVGGDGEEIDLVGDAFAGLDGGDIRVDEDGPDAFFAQGLQGLRTGIVEFAGLPDLQGAGSEHEHLGGFLHGRRLRGGGELSADRRLSDDRPVPHQGDEAVEEELRIQRAAAGLRMELDGEPGHAEVLEAFVGAVVHVDQQLPPAFRQGLAVQGVAMVLARDETAVGADEAYRLVVAAMAVFQFQDAGAGGDAEELVAQADAHDGFGPPSFLPVTLALLHHFPQDGDRLGTFLRVAGAVAQEDAVEIQFGIVIVPGDPQHFDAAAQQAADDVVLASAVHEDHPAGGLLFRMIEDGLPAGHFGDEIVGAVVLDGHVPGFHAFRHDASVHDAALAEFPGQRTGVDPGDGRDAFAAEPFIQALFRVPVTVFLAVVGHDQAVGVDVVAFEMLFQPVFLPPVGRDAVIADERKGGDQDLARIRGVGQAFRIAGHRRVENHLSRRASGKTEGFSFEAGAVFQNQVRFHICTKKPILLRRTGTQM